MDTTALIQELDREIARLEQVRELLAGKPVRAGKKSTRIGTRGAGGQTLLKTGPKKRVLSPEARARIAAAQRKRWAAHKKGAQ